MSNEQAHADSGREGGRGVILYFSGTGNSRFAARLLAKELGEELRDAGERIKAGDLSPLHSQRPWIVVAPPYVW